MGEGFAGPGFRMCSRAACRLPSVATLTFDYRARRAWIDEPKAGDEPGTYDLCSVHVERFGAPTGWESEDRRKPTLANSDVPINSRSRTGEANPGQSDQDEAQLRTQESR